MIKHKTIILFYELAFIRLISKYNNWYAQDSLFSYISASVVLIEIEAHKCGCYCEREFHFL